jgi:alpha-N-acetylglucosaminidase
MHGVGAGGAGSPGPTTALTEAWMTAQHALQQRILARMRELGIVPILPAFQGNVPPVMAELHPGANISVQGGGRHYAAWLDGTDPLFGKIADKYMQTMCADFGCDEHWYEADGYFAAGRPPWYDEEAAAVPQQAPSPPSPHRHHAQEAARALEASSGKAKKHCCCAEKQCSLPAKPACCSCCPSAPLNPAAVANAKTHALAAYTAMNRTDPQAIWYYQGWILGGQYSYIKGLTEAVRPGQLVISDMWCEGGGGIWKADNDFSFFNAPFIWGVLHNFGGNVGMWGDVSSLNSGPFDAFANASSIAGLGMFPEGIDREWITTIVAILERLKPWPLEGRGVWGTVQRELKAQRLPH